MCDYITHVLLAKIGAGRDSRKSTGSEHFYAGGIGAKRSAEAIDGTLSIAFFVALVAVLVIFAFIGGNRRRVGSWFR